MFRRTPSRVDRGRRVAVDFVVCFGCGGFFRDFFFRVFFSFERTRPAASMSPPCLICLSTSHEARPKERSDRGRFLLIGRKPLHTGVRTGCHYLINLSVCLSVCLSVSQSVCLSVCLCMCKCNVRRSYRLRELYIDDLWKWTSIG